jgi:hypothetical protein
MVIFRTKLLSLHLSFPTSFSLRLFWHCSDFLLFHLRKEHSPSLPELCQSFFLETTALANAVFKKYLLWLLVNYCPSYSVWQDYKDFSKERNLHSKFHIYFHQHWKYFKKYREVSFVRELNFKISCRMNFMTSEESFLLIFVLHSEWCELDFCRYS